MNTKSFAIGFATMDSVLSAGSAAKRGIVATKNGALNTSEVVTSFFAGAKQAVDLRRGTCRMLTLPYDVRPAPEIRALTHDVRSNEE